MIHGRSYVCEIHYHIVLAVKYRKKIIDDEIHSFLKKHLEFCSDKYEFEVISFNSDKDHIHILIETKPNFNIVNFIKYYKGSSSRKIFTKFDFLKKELYNGSFWNPSYAVFSVGNVEKEKVRIYIENQSTKDTRYFNSKKNK